MSQMNAKSTNQRTPQKFMYILYSFWQHWQFRDTFTLYLREGDPGIFIVIVAAGGATSLSPRWTWLVHPGQHRYHHQLGHHRYHHHLGHHQLCRHQSTATTIVIESIRNPSL